MITLFCLSMRGRNVAKWPESLNEIELLIKVGFNIEHYFFLDEKCKTIFQGEYSLSSLYLDNDTL